MNRKLSLRTQLMVGASLILSLVSLSAIIGYLSLRNLQSSIEATLVTTNEIREASLSIQNSFLLARQNELGLLSNWQARADWPKTGFGVPATIYVTAARSHLENAREDLNRVESLVHTSTDIHLHTLQTEIDTLRPLLDRYEANLADIEEILRALSTLGDIEDPARQSKKEILEADLAQNNAIAVDLANQIDEAAGMMGVKSKAGLERAQARLNQINRNANITLGISAGLTILLGTIAAAFVARRILVPIHQLSRAAEQLGQGNLSVRVPPEGGAEFTTLANTFNQMASQLQVILDGLEQRVTERTSDLQRRSAQLRIAAEISNEIARAEINEPRRLLSLLDHTVHQIRDRFGFAQVSIFLLTDDGEWAVLKATTWGKNLWMNEAGSAIENNVGLSQPDQEEVEKYSRFRFRVNETDPSPVSRAIRSGQPRFSSETGTERYVWRPNSLANIHSELALPLRVGLKVIGALDLQREQAGVFDQEDIIILQVVADQIVAAIQNAQLFQELQDRLRELETLYGDQSQTVWQRLARKGIYGYQYDRSEVAPIHIPTDLASNQWQANRAPIRLPIMVRGQEIGDLEIWPEGETWSEEQMNMIREITERLSQAIDSARLFEEVQDRASRELMLNRITSRIRASTNVDVIMQTAVQELAEAMNLSTAVIQMRSDFGGNP